MRVTEVSSTVHELPARPQLESLCMLRSSQFECGTRPCVAIAADPGMNSCMSACVVTYTYAVAVLGHYYWGYGS